MSNRKSDYADLEKWQRTTKRQKKKYYTSRQKPRKPWAEWEIEMIMTSSKTDTELSEIVGHGVGAIQVKRHKEKKKLKDDGGF